MRNVKNINTVVLPIAGLGSRFLPVTKSVPKELLPILNRPLIEYAVAEAKQSGIEKFIFVVSKDKFQVVKHFQSKDKLEKDLKMKSDQLFDLIREHNIAKENTFQVIQEHPLGLGHAIWCARKHIDGPFAVMLPDDIVFSKTPCIKQLISVYNKYKTSVIAVEEVPKEQVNKYGIIEISDSYSEDTLLVKAIVEKPKIADSPSNLAAIGRYILMPNIMDELAKKDIGEGGEIQLTDAIGKTINTSKCCAYRFEGERFDCGSVLGSLEAQIFAALKEDLYKKDTIKILNKFLKKDQ